MNFIKNIFDGNIDSFVHLQFQKFSRGEFRDRAIINARQSNGKYTIVTTAEFANGFVREVAKKLSDQKTRVTGAIVSTGDMKSELNFKEIKQFQGVKRYIIDEEMNGNEIIEIMDKFPKAFFALSFSAEKDYTVLKIKAKAPKSGKPGTKSGKKSKPNFCRLITKDKELGISFIFEKPDFKKAEITHNFIIKDIIKPEGETDFAKIRELAKRKGKIIRDTLIDEKKSTKEVEFIA